MTHLKAQETRRNNQERKQWKLRLIRGLYDKGYGREDVINLFTFIDWLLQLPQELEAEFWQAVEAYEQERKMPYVSSVERIGMRKGAQKQACDSLIQVLEIRFTTVPAKVQTHLQQLNIKQLKASLDSAMRAESMEDFVASLPQAREASPQKTRAKDAGEQQPEPGQEKID